MASRCARGFGLSYCRVNSSGTLVYDHDSLRKSAGAFQLGDEVTYLPLDGLPLHVARLYHEGDVVRVGYGFQAKDHVVGRRSHVRDVRAWYFGWRLYHNQSCPRELTSIDFDGAVRFLQGHFGLGIAFLVGEYFVIPRVRGQGAFVSFRAFDAVIERVADGYQN